MADNDTEDVEYVRFTSTFYNSAHHRVDDGVRWKTDVTFVDGDPDHKEEI
mgnify:CR=1 FL=1